jgi:hypothetical protein
MECRFDCAESSRSSKQKKINGLTRKIIQRFIEGGGLKVNVESSHQRLINGRWLERTCHVGLVKIMGSNQDRSKFKLNAIVKSQTDPNKEYNVEFCLKDCMLKDNEITMVSSENIASTICGCDDKYGDFVCNKIMKKCKHIVSALEGVRIEFVTDKTVKTAKSNEHWKVCSIHTTTSFFVCSLYKITK